MSLKDEVIWVRTWATKGGEVGLSDPASLGMKPAIPIEALRTVLLEKQSVADKHSSYDARVASEVFRNLLAELEGL